METKNLSNEIPLGKSYKLSITRNIGRGAFGEVFLGKNIKTNERVAVKMVKIKKMIINKIFILGIKENSSSSFAV